MADVTGKRDHLTGIERIFFVLVAVGLHVILVLLFSKEENQATDSGTQNRSNILFAENDPNFAGITQRINSEPDPTEFIRGGKTGYSESKGMDLYPGPESKNTIPALAENQNTTAEPDMIDTDRSYAELLTYSAKIPAKKLENPDSEKTIYPLWKDAYGVIRNIKTTYNGYNTRISINSNTVTAPTILQIQFNRKDQKDLPIYISLKQSCGDASLDQDAKRILQNHISEPGALKAFNQKYNDLVYIYWKPELNAVNSNSLPKEMFPEQEGGGI